jgi:hypothetical protein
MKVRCINDRGFGHGTLGMTVVYTVAVEHKNHYELVENKRLCWAKTRFEVVEEPCPQCGEVHV